MVLSCHEVWSCHETDTRRQRLDTVIHTSRSHLYVCANETDETALHCPDRYPGLWDHHEPRKALKHAMLTHTLAVLVFHTARICRCQGVNDSHLARCSRVRSHLFTQAFKRRNRLKRLACARHVRGSPCKEHRESGQGDGTGDQHLPYMSVTSDESPRANSISPPYLGRMDR